MPKTPNTPASLSREKIFSLTSPQGDAHKLGEKALLDSVYAGGYYVVYTNEEFASSSGERATKTQQKRNKKNEEALQLANLTRQLIDNLQQPHSEPETREHSRHERILEDLNTLIHKSDLVQNSHEQQLHNAISTAREQILRGDSIDDRVLLQSLTEIAELQGLSLAGSAAAGQFSAEIIETPEQPKLPASAPQTSGNTLGSTPFEQDRAEYLQREFDQFSAYDISEVGGGRQNATFSFAHTIIESLVATDTREKAEENTNEIQA